jgi:hypothetical protein
VCRISRIWLASGLRQLVRSEASCALCNLIKGAAYRHPPRPQARRRRRLTAVRDMRGAALRGADRALHSAHAEDVAAAPLGGGRLENPSLGDYGTLASHGSFGFPTGTKLYAEMILNCILYGLMLLTGEDDRAIHYSLLKYASDDWVRVDDLARLSWPLSKPLWRS